METMTFEKLINKVKEYNECEIEYITKAYNFASKHHEGQVRKSGEPYISHPLAVTYILASMKADRDTLCAGLLHDVVEDTDVTLDDLRFEFNDTVAKLVDGVTKMNKINFNSKQEMEDANTRKLITSITKDARIIIIKLADRLHNMRTLEFKSENKQIENSIETLEIFIPLANHIGAYKIKRELEDLVFYYLNKETYKRLKEEVNDFQKKAENSTDEMIYTLTKELYNHEINSRIEKEMRSIYSIYKDLQEFNKLEDIHNLLSLKICVDEIKDCYYSLGLVHSKYIPLANRFKDYICQPKTNMYQSLHTTVFGNDGYLVQTKIRTNDMDRIATYGLTGYWDVLKGKAGSEMQKDLNNKFQFYKTLQDINDLVENNEEFVEVVKNEVLNKNIYIYTTTGLIIELPYGSTPLDFAYKIGLEYGKNACAFMVDGELVPLNYKLKNNQIVKIIEGPKKIDETIDINQIVTTKAKTYVKKLTNTNEN